MLRILLLVVCCLSLAQAAQVRLFILSGQSNMANLEPEVSFIPTLKTAFPDDDLVVVKVAFNGQQIRRWVADWQPPEGMEVPKRMARNGGLYKELIGKIATAMEGKADPVSVSFCWHQGEADAGHGYHAVYEASLRKVYAQLQADLKRQDITWVIARISDYAMDTDEERPGWRAVRDIHVKIAESLPQADWVDTDDLNGESNGLHYPKEGYAELGKRFAEKTIALIKKQGQ